MPTPLHHLHRLLLQYRTVSSSWHALARPNQRLPPGEWLIWLILAGRGFGKTRTGAETVRHWAEQTPVRIGLIAATLEEGRKIMIEGVSGLLAVCPSVRYCAARGEIFWPNGSQATLFSAGCPEKLRGPQFHFIWVDEMAKFRHLQTVWDHLRITLRLGHQPRMIITTTPRPHPLWHRCLQDPCVVTTRGTTRDNTAYLSPGYVDTLEALHANSPWALQELHGHLIEDHASPWTVAMIAQARCLHPVPFVRSRYQVLVVALDPAVSVSGHSAETGLVVVGKTWEGQIHVLQDASDKMSSTHWAKQAVQLYQTYTASCIVAETNQGGDLVHALLQQIAPHVRYMPVKALKNKWARAQPVVALYAQGRVTHHGFFGALEHQLLHPDQHFDRMDALVWGVYALEQLVQHTSSPLTVVSRQPTEAAASRLITLEDED